LIELLSPHIVVVSMAERYLDGVAGREWQELYVVQKKRRWTVRSQEIRIGSGHAAVLVHAPAQTLPFGPFTSAEKRHIGQLVALLHQPR
jgi:hypothetical protein